MEDLKLYNSFIIVIPVCNAELYIKQSLLSVLNQQFNDLGIIIRDDISTDTTPNIIEKLVGTDGVNKRTSLILGKNILHIRNSTKYFGGGNTYDSVVNHIGNKSAIVGVVDGDDWLIDEFAVEKISSVYSQLDVWQVWSQHQSKCLEATGLTGYSSQLPDDATIYANRNYWSVSHFRTCFAWLYDAINPNDLFDPFEGSHFCRFAGDAANIYPITELCGNSKSFFYDQILYYYNDELSSNEIRISADNVKRYSDYIRGKIIYEPYRLSVP